MVKTKVKKKLFIANLRGNMNVGNLYFEGNDSKEGESDFDRALKDLPAGVKGTKTWDEYVTKAIKHFESRGFLRIQK